MRPSLGRIVKRKHKSNASHQGEQKDTEPTTKSVLDQVPLDVLLYISTFPDPVAQASLVLAIRGLYGLYRNALTPLVADHNDRRFFLHLIEHDRPFLLRCSYCHKLYKWHSIAMHMCYDHGCGESRKRAFDAVHTGTAGWDRSAFIEKTNELIGISCAAMDWFRAEATHKCDYNRPDRRHYSYLTPAIRDLVLRYAHYKDLDHGLPTHELDHECSPTQETFDMGRPGESLNTQPNSMKIAACVAGETLLLRYEREYNVVYYKNHAWWLNGACSDERGFCRHQVDHLSHVVEFIMSSGALRDLKCQSIYLNCESCPTDWLVTIAAEGDSDEDTGENSFAHLGEDGRLHRVWLTAWHDLGTRSQSSAPVFDEDSNRTYQWPNHPWRDFGWGPGPKRDRCLALGFCKNYETGNGEAAVPRNEQSYIYLDELTEDKVREEHRTVDHQRAAKATKSSPFLASSGPGD
ncbi:uncharacterized protein AB675_6492 [Cyphellophora attinorum]|uniref:Uncharacterized protein n=1 Tax=Cyphellophora attinorum TaxID=1664694 RepID=A0A0N1HYR5_9EURO|nr:uncharacterized protein AB675_6492 [Phialophora attinorum]KPI43687.1 hypothetical protein AB675_6492 [Phialophora attinorum]